MSELKRVFSDAKMNKDMDERIVPNGQYRDANNIEIATSEGSSVGTVQSILSTVKRSNIDQGLFLSTAYNAGVTNIMGPHRFSTCVASVAAPDKDKIYSFVSGGDKSTDNTLLALRKDYILQYDTVTKKSKYVFVDIYHSSTTVSGDEVDSTNFYIALDEGDGPTNKTGIRVGMTLGDTNIKVTGIVYVADGTNKWKITTDQAHGLLDADDIVFTSPRVLNFSKNILITGINVLDDFIFWTDNHFEPKRISIERSIAGTGGTVVTGADTPLIGDNDHFHTRLVKNKVAYADIGNELELALDGALHIFIEEQHVTVIKKAPKQPLELEMYRTSGGRVDSAGVENPITTVLSDGTDQQTFVGSDGALLEPGDEVNLPSFDSVVDYRVGDIVLISRSDNALSPNSFTDYDIRAEVISSDVDPESPDVLYLNGFALRLLSISSDLPTTSLIWYFKLEDKRPLFENEFPRFSYRYKYQDGEYSTFAPWSQIAFLPDLYDYLPKKGYNLGMVNQLRGLKLKGYYGSREAMPQDVAEIDLLYKESGKPTVYTVKTIKKQGAIANGGEWPDLSSFPNKRGEFEITTDIVHAVVPSNQILRPWDNVPRKALAQEISANRLIYGNYLQNYTVLEEAAIALQLEQKKLKEAGYDYAAPSVKTMRKYQVGVVYSDSYGRETPVLTTKKSSISVKKDASDTKNRLVCNINAASSIPTWAKYLSYYIKETSVEYYTMAMDRWYTASDGNVWISFPSSERNKLDNETFIVLKKGHGTNTAIKDKARYRILAIKSEAPDFIKTERKPLGKVLDAEGQVIGAGGYGWPLVDTNLVVVEKAAFEGSFGDQLHILTPDSLYIRLYGQGLTSNAYEVASLALAGDYYRIQISEKFNDDVSFTSDDGTYNTAISDLSVELIEYEVENRPEFDGRFFVKIHSDETLKKHVLIGQQEDYFVSNSWKLAYLNNNGYKGVGAFSGETFWNTQTLTTNIITNNLTAYNNVDGLFTAPSYVYTTGERRVTATGLHPTEYLHHSAPNGLGQQEYWWGDEDGSEGGVDSVEVGLTGVSQDNIDNNPLYALNDDTIEQVGESQEFWDAVRGKFSFFIDAASAYSWTGYKTDTPGMYGDRVAEPPSWYVPSSEDSNQNPRWIGSVGDMPSWVNGSNAEDQAGWGADNGEFGNTKKGRGQPSRGIWHFGGSDVSYMDISWSGLGNHSGTHGFNNSNEPFFHRLQEFYEGWGGGTESDDFYRAGKFINTLVVPGTKFRFARDPDKHVYEVKADSFPTLDGEHYPDVGQYNGGELPGDPGTYTGTITAQDGPGYIDDSTFKSGTNMFTGVWGIRNFRTNAQSGDTGDKDKNQYMPENLRQRWTLTVSPKIGSMGPSYYSPTKGTGGYEDLDSNGTFTKVDTSAPSNIEDNYRRALRHDFTGPYDAIQILDSFTDASIKGGFVDNPAIWETEPKESVELDIYYQASGLIPLELNSSTNEEYIPIGSTFQAYSSTGASVEHTVTAWTSGNAITFTPALSALTPISNSDTITFTKRGNYSLTAVTNSGVSAGATTMTLHGGPGTINNSHKLFSQKQYLDWNNCWSFGNGVESDRVRDDFNTAQVDNGVKASTVLGEQIKEERRKHGLIWSGIYNSNSGVNDTNQFIAAEKITKDLNPIYGSIQALLNRDTRLVMFCEDKVLRGVTNKDALYNADGKPQLVASNAVIGDVTPYKGDYGISKNPESIAVTPNTTYFADSIKGRVLALSTEGIRSISDIGMKDYFSDSMSANVWRCLGTYDDRKKEYNLSTYKKYTASQPTSHDNTTASYSEISKGWVSFKSFHPQSGLSLNNNYYTFYNGGLWEHYAGTSYNTFYDIPSSSDVTILLNDQPEVVKKFMTINYEGSQQNVPAFVSSSNASTYTGVIGEEDEGVANVAFTDGEYYNLAAQDGWYLDNLATNLQTCGQVYFKNKEDKYFGYPSGETTILSNLDEREFSVQGIGVASITHNNSALGNSITITVQNDLDDTSWDTSGVQAVETSHWTCSSVALSAEGNANIPSGTIATLEISSIIDGVYSGYPLSAANFELGEYGSVSGLVYTVDSESNVTTPTKITSVTFSDTGVAGSPSNTVSVAVLFDSSEDWPSADAVYEIDIDEKAAAAVTETRDFYLKTQYSFLDTGFQANPVVADITDVTEVVVEEGSTASANIDFSNPTINSHTGSVENGVSTKVVEIQFTAAAGKYYMGGATAPSVAFENLGGYTDSYIGQITDITYSQPNHIEAFKAKVFYTPPQDSSLLIDESVMANLGHKAVVNYQMKSDPVPDDVYDITNVVNPSNIAHGPAAGIIKVYGASSATYKIYVQKKISTTSGSTASTGGYYNFTTNAFQNATAHGVGKISPSGLSLHTVSLPSVAADTRYDVTIEAVGSATAGQPASLSAQVPTVPGDAIMIHRGVRKLTIRPVTQDIADFASLPTVVFSRPALYEGSTAQSTQGETVSAVGGTGGVSSTKLAVVSDYKRIKHGMVLMSAFNGTTAIIPSGITVADTRRGNITLSAVCTIPTGTKLQFVEANTLIPFSITVERADSHTFTLKTGIDYRASVSGLSSNIETLVNGTPTNTISIPVDSSKGIEAGMMVTGAGIVSDPAYGYARVASKANTTSVTTTSNQTLADNTVLSFSWPEDDPTLPEYDEFGGGNTGVKLRHVVATCPTSLQVKVDGYVQISSINSDGFMNLHLDEYINVGGH